MDDALDETPRYLKQRPKDSFQNELQAKLKQRKYQGKSIDISDSDDNDFSGSRDIDFSATHSERPSAPKRRQRHSQDLTQGLGTQTTRAKDLSRLINHSLSDDDDEEIVAANLGKTNSRESLLSSGLTPSPRQESKYLRKTARKDRVKNSEPVLGKTTPIAETRSHSSLSKEGTIFGRRTPTVDGKKSPKDGVLKHLLGEDGDNQWQPPKYRNISPKDAELSKGSRGVSPVDSSLEVISESSREKVTPRIQRGERIRGDALPSQGDKPKPQQRNKMDKSKTPPLAEHHRKSPSYQRDSEEGTKKTTPTIDSKRTTPTRESKRTSPVNDIFGHSRSAAAQEVEEYIGGNKDKEEKGRKTPTSRDQTPETKRGTGSRDKTPEKAMIVKFAMDDRKTQSGQKTPTDSSGRKSPLAKKSHENDVASASKESSLLDFLMDEGTSKTPKSQARSRRPRGKESLDDLEDIFGNTKKVDKVNSMDEQKSPMITGTKTSEHARKSPLAVDKHTGTLQGLVGQQTPEDTSSLCEEIPPDPNRKVAQQEDRLRKQTTDRVKADNVIEAISLAQSMKYIEPAKKMRPRTASAKVQHRPKPRYGTLTGDTTKSLQERQFNSTGDIRDAIYEEWYKEHLCSARLKKKEEEKKMKEEKEKKKKEEEQKHHEGEASYKAWMEKKKKTLLEDQKKKEIEEKLVKEKKEREERDKKEHSQKLFQSWKVKKDDLIKKELLRKSQETKKAEEEKKRKKIEEQKERESAHKSWLNKKEQQHVKEVKEKNKEKKEKSNKGENEKEELKKKEESAENQYFEWIEKKEKQAQLDKTRTKRRMDDDDFKPAWLPASHTIPFGR